MNPKITWDMRSGLPNQQYLEFATRYLLQQNLSKSLVDPFALDIPREIEGVYVEREEIEKEISRQGTIIIIGPEGRGKTTLFKKLPALLSHALNDRSLIVNLPLTEIGPSIPEQEFVEGKSSLLTVGLLIQHIFNAYWQDLLLEPARFARFYPQLRQDERWCARLRWFYRNYPPIQLEVEGQFELLAWLHARRSGSLIYSKSSPENILRELARFVTFVAPSGFGPPVMRQPYTQIQVLVDGAESLSPKAITRLIQDAQRLYALSLHQVQFKLFIDSGVETQITAMDCVRQSRVNVYRLPEWNEQDLRRLLVNRLKAYNPGEFGFSEYYEWGRLIPEVYLEPTAQAQFVETIIQTARHPSEHGKDKNDLDAVIHVLRVARAFVAACAGCWEQQGYKPPLNLETIHKLANCYWDTKGVEK